MLYTLFPLVANLYQTTKDVIKVGTRAETSNILTQKKKKKKDTIEHIHKGLRAVCVCGVVACVLGCAFRISTAPSLIPPLLLLAHQTRIEILCLV